MIERWPRFRCLIPALTLSTIFGCRSTTPDDVDESSGKPSEEAGQHSSTGPTTGEESPTTSTSDASTSTSQGESTGDTSGSTGDSTPPDFLDTEGIVELELKGDLQEHFDLAFAGIPDGIFPPERIKQDFVGTVTLAGDDRPVTGNIRVRGNSSLQECPFAKLRMKTAKSSRPDSPFETTWKFKVGTHCDDSDLPGTIGRLRNEKATHREAYIYAAMQVLGFVSMRARPARVTYIDDTAPWSPRTRDAFVFEHLDVLARRMQATAVDVDEHSTVIVGSWPATAELAPLVMFQAMVGNWDWRLPLERPETAGEMWNLELLHFDDGRNQPVLHDFDLASLVTGKVYSDIDDDLLPDHPNPFARQAVMFLNKMRGDFSPADFSAARAYFETHRATLEQTLDDAPMDPEGRVIAEDHLEGFFDALTSPGQ